MKKELNLSDLALSFVALEGFEPSQAEPESDVLPLHHKAVLLGVISLLRVQSYNVFFYSAKFFDTFFQKKFHKRSFGPFSHVFCGTLRALLK